MAHRLPLLSSLDASGLAARLSSAGAAPGQARSAAAKAMKHALAANSDVDWDAASLSAIGVGKACHAALLDLDPSLSLTVDTHVVATDGTERLALRARDGALIETVIIPGPARTTVCISSQVGCARACTFCETGKLGLSRQLDAGEIVDQVRLARRVRKVPGPPIQNVVFMGMGEPFDNLSAVSMATRVLTDPRGLGLSPSRITVSTVGVADKLATFFADCRAELAVSLNAPDDRRRSAIMPINKRFDLEKLLGALERHLPRGKRVLFEYVLIAGFNDALEDADLVARIASRVPSRVNVIPVNPGPDPANQPPDAATLDAFVKRLAEHRVTTLVRKPRGRDVGGACGQLAGSRRGMVSEPVR